MKLNKRKNIIISLQSLQGKPKRGIDKRILFLKVLSVLGSFFLMASVGIVFFSILSETINTNLINLFKWKNISSFVIFSLIFLFNTPNAIYELKLLQHLKRINLKMEVKSDKINELNKELAFIIDTINSRNSKIVIYFLTLCVLGVSVWQLSFHNESFYWGYMKYPILIFYFFTIVRFIIIHKKLTKNIEEVENILL